MFGFLQSVVLLFPVIAMRLMGAQGCDDGWFGRKCNLMCQCSNSQVCGNRGECPGICTPGYFGPGCQYVDLVYRFGTPPSLVYLADNNETTCNPDPAARYIHLTFSRVISFLWLRISTKGQDAVRNFTISFNANRSCENERRFPVNANTMDVTCNLPLRVTEILIDGQIIPSVCSLYITPGRDVALRQPVQHTGNADNSSQAAKTVDGSKQSNSCSESPPSHGVRWQLVFNQPHYLVTAIVYNTHNRSNQFRLKGFHLHTYDGGNVLTNSFTDDSLIDKSVYEVPLSPVTPVVTVVITPSKLLPANDTILALCEVSLIGESLCPEGTYGLECEQRCVCKATDICNTVTGACAPGCPPPNFGVNCLSVCSTHCLMEVCYQRMGECVHCHEGYHGAFCDNECDLGKYGQRCVFNCSENCNVVCDSRTGECSCKPPYTGTHCTECPVGKYGPQCTELCHRACLKRKCDADTGECLGCAGSRVGPHCEDCPDGSYGPLCYRSCSQHCLNMTCDFSTGNCSVCVNDYSGAQCLDAPWQEKHWMWFVIAVPMIVILTSLISMCWAFYLKRSWDPNTPRSSGSGSSEGTLSEMSTNMDQAEQ